jgi:hypothetical protein
VRRVGVVMLPVRVHRATVFRSCDEQMCGTVCTPHPAFTTFSSPVRRFHPFSFLPEGKIDGSAAPAYDSGTGMEMDWSGDESEDLMGCMHIYSRKCERGV